MTCICVDTEVSVEIDLENIVRDYREEILKILNENTKATEILATVWEEVKLAGPLKFDVEEYLRVSMHMTLSSSVN